MAQYALHASSFQAGQVGDLYNIGLSDGTRSYGYVFQNDPKKGMKESSDVTSKAALIQYSSPNLIDRDLAFFPRVTQGDYSGGLLQVVLLDTTKEFDSDLEIRTPGYLTLRPAWKRTQLAAGSVGTYQSINWNNDIFTVWGTTGLYNSAGLVSNAPINLWFIDTDGAVISAADKVGNLYNWDGTSWSIKSDSAHIGLTQIDNIWVVNLGTAGRFCYLTFFAGFIANLYKLDLSLVQNSAAVQVPLGSPTFRIVDMCPYQTGIAILSKDATGGGNSDVWYHDGQNLTRIVHLQQYVGQGLTNCLGNLYVTASSEGGFEAPALLQVTSGSIQVVAKLGTPLSTSVNSAIGSPVASGQYVYFAVTSPQIPNVSPVSYIVVYDVVTQSVSHLGNFDGADNPQATQARQLATSGRAVAVPMNIGGSSYLQYQTNTANLPAGNLYASSGWLVSSRYDFSTPGIPKRFRRIDVVHSPLAAGESVTVKAFVDQDPLAFTTSLAPVPSGATATGNTVGQTTTSLTMGADTVGKTLYYALNLQGNGSSTPKVRQVSVEIGGTWTWNLDLDCTSIRRRLDASSDDSQGVTGKDLYFLLRNAYENGVLLTLYLASGLSYTVAIESLNGDSPGYVNHQGTPIKADEEWLVNVVLRQAA